MAIDGAEEGERAVGAAVPPGSSGGGHTGSGKVPLARSLCPCPTQLLLLLQTAATEGQRGLSQSLGASFTPEPSRSPMARMAEVFRDAIHKQTLHLEGEGNDALAEAHPTTGATRPAGARQKFPWVHVLTLLCCACASP